MAWCDFAIYPTASVNKSLCKSQKQCDGTLAIIRQVFGENSMSRTQSPSSSKPENARQLKSKVKSMLIISFDFKGVVYKAFVQACQTFNTAYYCDFFGAKRTGCCITTTHRLTLPFHQGYFFFLPKTTWLSSPTHPTFLFSRLKVKVKDGHFDTTEVIEAESQNPHRITISRMNTPSWVTEEKESDILQGQKVHFFSVVFRSALGPNQPPVRWVPPTVCPEKQRLGREADHLPPFTSN
jgi:hypothetical protein